MKTSHLALASLVIIGLLSILLWKQQATIRKLTAQNIELQQRAAQSESVPSPDISANSSSPSDSEKKTEEKEHLELMRLRAEVARLRGQQLESGASAEPLQPRAEAGTNSLQQIVQVLSDTETSPAANARRFAAAQKLRALGPQAVAGLPQFVDLLRSGSEPSAYAGAEALVFISESSPEAFQNLANGLSDPDAQVRDAASHGIGLLVNQQFKNVDTDSLLPIMLRNLQDADRTVRMDSANVVNEYIEVQQRLGKPAQPEVVIPALAQSLNDENSNTRLTAVLGIAKYGNQAQAMAPEISKLLQDPDAQVQRAAKSALQQINSVPGANP